MCKLRQLRNEYRLLSIPLDAAIYCQNCENITNSSSDRCGKCGSRGVLSMAGLIEPSPGGPDSGPASAGRIVPILYTEIVRAA